MKRLPGYKLHDAGTNRRFPPSACAPSTGRACTSVQLHEALQVAPYSVALQKRTTAEILLDALRGQGILARTIWLESSRYADLHVGSHRSSRTLLLGDSWSLHDPVSPRPWRNEVPDLQVGLDMKSHNARSQPPLSAFHLGFAATRYAQHIISRDAIETPLIVVGPHRD